MEKDKVQQLTKSEMSDKDKLQQFIKSETSDKDKLQQLTKSETSDKDKLQQLIKSEMSDKDKLQQLTKLETSMVFKEVHKPIKIINVDHGEVKNDSPQARLSLNRITLTNEDKEIIQMGGQLNDIHMNFAQILLKQQFILNSSSVLAETNLYKCMW